MRAGGEGGVWRENESARFPTATHAPVVHIKASLLCMLLLFSSQLLLLRSRSATSAGIGVARRRA